MTKTCPKCSSTSGNDWSQCRGSCPMEGSPHYQPNGVDFDLWLEEIETIMKNEGYDPEEWSDCNGLYWSSYCDDGLVLTPQEAWDDDGILYPEVRLRKTRHR